MRWAGPPNGWRPCRNCGRRRSWRATPGKRHLPGEGLPRRRPGFYTLLPPDPQSTDYRADPDREGESIVRAVREAGVRHVVFLSSVGADHQRAPGRSRASSPGGTPAAIWRARTAVRSCVLLRELLRNSGPDQAPGDQRRRPRPEPPHPHHRHLRYRRGRGEGAAGPRLKRAWSCTSCSASAT